MEAKHLPVFALACMLAFLSSVRLEAAYDDHIWLHVEGKHIVTSDQADPPNQIFVPIGMAGGEDSRYLDEFAEFVKGHGGNLVRFAIHTTNLGNRDKTWEGELARILEWLEVARRHKLYTILDNHEYLGYSETVTYTSPAQFQEWKDHFKEIADSAKDNPWLLGYELMNEIYTRSISMDSIQLVLRECAQVIRTVDQRHLIFLPLHGFDLSGFDVLDPPQIVSTPHTYPTSLSATNTVAAWAEDRDAHPNPYLCTEFSAGTMANGYTYHHNKKWLKDFLDAAQVHKIGWLIWYFRGALNGNNDPSVGGDYFTTVYGPDDPDIWVPAAKAMSELYPIPNNGIPNRIEFDRLPVWFEDQLATGEEYELTLRIVDTTGSMVTGSNASVTVSVSGPATLSSTPSSFTKGKATVSLKANVTPGTITVTASGGGVSGSQTFTSADTWTDFQIQKQDDSWINSGETSDDATPACRIKIQHPGKGIALQTAYYDYSTDGGDSWIYWDADLSDEFDSDLNTLRWTTEDHNTTGGSATVSNGKLKIHAEGEDVWSEYDLSWWMTNTFAKDEFYMVHEERTGGFEIVTKIDSQEDTDPTALAGILVRDNMNDVTSNGLCYVAATPDSGYVFGWKSNGIVNNGRDKSLDKYVDTRVFAGDVTYPCYLKLSKIVHPSNYEGTETTYNRQYQIFTASYSTDGVNWTKITSRWIPYAAKTQRVGLFACSGKDGTYGDVEFDFYRVANKASLSDESITSRYSAGAEQFVTSDIPFVMNNGKAQEVRFRIHTCVDYNEFMNNPGELLVSPRYTVYEGEHVAVQPTVAKAAPTTMNVASVRGALRLGYTVLAEKISNLRFSVYDLTGRQVWSRNVARPASAGALKWTGTNGTGVPAGTYIVKMEAVGKKHTKTLHTATMHL